MKVAGRDGRVGEVVCGLEAELEADGCEVWGVGEDSRSKTASRDSYGSREQSAADLDLTQRIHFVTSARRANAHDDELRVVAICIGPAVRPSRGVVGEQKRRRAQQRVERLRIIGYDLLATVALRADAWLIRPWIACHQGTV